MASTAIPALQTLDRGSIQDLVTLPSLDLTLIGIQLQQGKPKCWLRFLQNLDSEGQQIQIKVVDGVDKWPQLLSQPLKHLIEGRSYKI